MGAYLSHPVTDKKSTEGENAALAYGVSAMQGWRTSMEDAHTTVLDLEKGVSLFGVFDGHGGREVARFCSRHLAEAIVTSESYTKEEYGQALIHAYLRMDEMMCTEAGRRELLVLAKSDEPAASPGAGAQDRSSPRDGPSSSGNPALQRLESLNDPSAVSSDSRGGGGEDGGPDDMDSSEDRPHEQGSVKRTRLKGLLADTLRGISRKVTGSGQYCGPVAGCTAVAALVFGNQLLVANAGDSRAVLSRSGTAVALSQDHKPDHAKERERIVRAGGFIAEGRVNGSLNLSRAIGDMEYKQSTKLPPAEQIVTAYPDVQQVQLGPGDEFMVLACDGIWDVMTNQSTVDFVRQRLKESLPLSRICEELMDACIAKDTAGTGLGCDNMSVIVVVFKDHAAQLGGSIKAGSSVGKGKDALGSSRVESA